MYYGKQKGMEASKPSRVNATQRSGQAVPMNPGADFRRDVPGPTNNTARSPSPRPTTDFNRMTPNNTNNVAKSLPTQANQRAQENAFGAQGARKRSSQAQANRGSANRPSRTLPTKAAAKARSNAFGAQGMSKRKVR